MPDFMFVYRNPAGYTPTPETRAAWTAWFDGMGQHLADLGKLVTARTALTSDTGFEPSDASERPTEGAPS